MKQTITYRVKTELRGWSEPLTIEIAACHWLGGLHGTAFTILGRKHPGAVGIEILGAGPATEETKQ